MIDSNNLFIPRAFRRDRPPTPNPHGEEEGLIVQFDFSEHAIQQQQCPSELDMIR